MTKTLTKPTNLTYTIEPSLSLLYIFAYGSVELQDILVYEQIIWQDPLRQPGMKIIVDLSHVTEGSFELPDLRSQIDLNIRMLDKGYALEPTALIGRHDYDVDVGQIIEMRVQLEAPIIMAVFLKLSEAVDWLGLTEAYDQIVQIRRRLREKAFGLNRT